MLPKSQIEFPLKRSEMITICRNMIGEDISFKKLFVACGTEVYKWIFCDGDSGKIVPLLHHLGCSKPRRDCKTPFGVR